MTVFAVCLLGVGAVLSLITRVHGLLVVAFGVVLASAVVVLLRSLQAAPASSLGVTLIVAIVALQVGYGLGVVARAVLATRLGRSTGSTPGTPTRHPVEESEQPISRES